jgi:hypothetical protein
MKENFQLIPNFRPSFRKQSFRKYHHTIFLSCIQEVIVHFIQDRTQEGREQTLQDIAL